MQQCDVTPRPHHNGRLLAIRSTMIIITTIQYKTSKPPGSVNLRSFYRLPVIKDPALMRDSASNRCFYDNAHENIMRYRVRVINKSTKRDAQRAVIIGARRSRRPCSQYCSPPTPHCRHRSPRRGTCQPIVDARS